MRAFASTLGVVEIMALLAAVPLGFVAFRKLIRGLMTWPAIAPTPWLSRRLSHIVRSRTFSGDAFFAADGADAPVVARRRSALDRLSAQLAGEFSTSAAYGQSLLRGFSDLRFTDASRVPFRFAAGMAKRFNLVSIVTASRGPYLQHLDGHWTLDVGGSYGLNVAGFDRYKDWIAAGWERVRQLGPVLGPLHPDVAENVAALRRVSGLDEVSFHMSGTEAVMAAVRLARFNTGRRLIVCFSGAYHGWWDGVQPGLGNERDLGDCLTLKDMHPGSLDVIRRRRREIAAVLVNPVQAFHPNSPPPNDAVLLTSTMRAAESTTERYAAWLQRLAGACRAAGVPLVLDEVYTGFRLAPGGAREFFGLDADMIVYGKTVAGGLPIGVVCGRAALMRRVDPDRPMRMAYVVGTFSAHPLVMGAMHEFLKWVDTPDAAELYARSNARCHRWVIATNRDLLEANMPVRVVALGTVWTVLFKQAGRYNWLLQYYLRAEGLTLSWVGTGRCLVSLDFSDADYDVLRTKVVTAVRRMHSDGWWLGSGNDTRTEAQMQRRLVREMLDSVVPIPDKALAFYDQVMRRKADDHQASHRDPWNQYLHLLSSGAFIFCYAIIFNDLTTAMFLGLGSLRVRQFGHAVLEPECHEREMALLGFSTINKTAIVGVFLSMPLALVARAGDWSVAGLLGQADLIAQCWFAWMVSVIVARVVVLTRRFDFHTAMVWFVKLVTDPFTDLAAYRPWRAQGA